MTPKIWNDILWKMSQLCFVHVMKVNGVQNNTNWKPLIFIVCTTNNSQVEWVNNGRILIFHWSMLSTQFHIVQQFFEYD